MQLQDIQIAIRASHTRVGGHAIQEAAADNLLFLRYGMGCSTIMLRLSRITLAIHEALVV